MTDFIDPRLKDALRAFWPDIATVGSHVGGETVAGTGAAVAIDDPATGKSYRLNDAPAVLLARPRGLHLPEKHVLVDGETVDIPSYRIRLGETVGLHPRSRDLPPVVATLDQPRGLEHAPWLAVDAPSRTAQVTELPERGSVLLAVKTPLVVEYYSQRL